MPKLIAKWWIAMLTTLLVWALLAPIVATAGRNEQSRHDCPSIRVTHGVGPDLRTFERRTDKCSMYR